MQKMHIEIDLTATAFSGDSLGPQLTECLRLLSEKFDRDHRVTIESFGGKRTVEAPNGDTVGFFELV